VSILERGYSAGLRRSGIHPYADQEGVGDEVRERGGALQALVGVARAQVTHDLRRNLRLSLVGLAYENEYQGVSILERGYSGTIVSATPVEAPTRTEVRAVAAQITAPSTTGPVSEVSGGVLSRSYVDPRLRTLTGPVVDGAVIWAATESRRKPAKSTARSWTRVSSSTSTNGVRPGRSS
jgi:hypothetical protein